MSNTPLTDRLCETAWNSEPFIMQCRVLEAALRDLVKRCDGAEGVRADGSNIDTRGAHAALGDFQAEDN